MNFDPKGKIRGKTTLHKKKINCKKGKRSETRNKKGVGKSQSYMNVQLHFSE